MEILSSSPFPGDGSGTLTAEAFVSNGGSADVVIDVFGYFAFPAADAADTAAP